MSAGAFQLGLYETDGGAIVAVKAQPETFAASIGGTVNASKTGSQTIPDLTIKTSGGRRESGIKPRTVTLRFTGSPPATYKSDSPVTIPIMDRTHWLALAKGVTGTYLSVACEVVSKTAEKIN